MFRLMYNLMYNTLFSISPALDLRQTTNDLEVNKITNTEFLLETRTRTKSCHSIRVLLNDVILL